MTRIICYLLLFGYSKLLSGVEPKGFIALNYTINEYVDSIKIPIYRSIEGEIIGNCRIRPANGENGPGFEINDLYGKKFPSYKYPLEPLKDSKYYAVRYWNTNNIDSCEYYGNGYQLSTYHLTYYDKKENYLKILANTVEGGAWIELDEKLFKANDWVQEIINNWYGPYVYGFDNYRLRKSPSLDGEVITKLKDTQYTMVDFIRRKGHWIEVSVCELKQGIEITCEEVQVTEECIEIFTGWLRIVDPYGMPDDIWFYPDC